MADLTNLNQALLAVQDPRTPAADLATIAQRHPELRRLVAAHSNAYPGLLDWLDNLGDPDLSKAVAERRQSLPPSIITTGVRQPAHAA